MDKKKQELIDLLSSVKNNFDSSNTDDYKQLILLLYQMIINQESDQDIICILQGIIDNICSDNISDSLIESGDYSDYSDGFQRMFSFRLFNPLNEKYNYINNR